MSAHDRAALTVMAEQARMAIGIEDLNVVADRGCFGSDEIFACEQAGTMTDVPKPLTSNSKADGRFGKQDFAYVPEKNEYRCPAGQSLIYRYTNLEGGMTTHAIGAHTASSVRSSRNAPICRTDAYGVGSMRTSSMRCSADSIASPRR